ncbi:hypothetical protein QTO34_014312 [Cnephaeus nilssonii]|uniref:Uncharacterized protein n=1 Tax=Cnephaeus nilssonii TaxID=3371016 RepID=A0AA40I6A3_CNENI|nr:hypothetical protein QTO34_014312 [Eptesicus nilssonii]
MLQACEEGLGKQGCPELKAIPMSANTVKRRIEDMAEDIENQVIKMESYRKNCWYFVCSTCLVEPPALSCLKHLTVISWNTELHGKNVLGYVQTVRKHDWTSFRTCLLQR